MPRTVGKFALPTFGTKKRIAQDPIKREMLSAFGTLKIRNSFI